MSGMNTEVMKLTKLARQQRWDVSFTGGNHLRWTPPNGGDPIITGVTPSTRGWRNDLANLKRAGLVVNAGELRAQNRAERRANRAHEPMVDGDATNVLDIEARLRERVQQRVLAPCATTPANPTEHQEPQVSKNRYANTEAFSQTAWWCRTCGKEMWGGNIVYHFEKHHNVDTRGYSLEQRMELLVRTAEELHPSLTPRPMLRRQGSTRRTKAMMEAAGASTSTGGEIEQPPVAIHPRIAETDKLVESRMQDLVKVLFPEGFPMDPDALMLLAEWVEPTKKFVREVLGLSVMGVAS